MQTNLTWKKGIFSDLYSIYQDGQLIGELKEKPFSQTAQGDLKGAKYSFKTKGFLKQRTEIIDLKDNKVIGEITYSSWKTKATLTLNGKEVHWKYDNPWNTKWSLYDSKDIHIQYTSSTTKGNIDSNVDDELLLLSGLVVTNYFSQVSIVLLIAIFIPLWASIFN